MLQDARQIFRLFPELKESKNERISREITEFLVDFNNGEYERPNENTIDSWLSWLEKQCKKDSQVIFPTFTFEDILAVKCCMQVMSKSEELYKKLQSLYDRLHDTVRPKFNVCDWITNGDYTWKIVEVKSLDYILQSQDGNIVDDTISHVDGNFSSFTIKNAKDGDVLVFDDIIMIFKNIRNDCPDICTANTYILYCNVIAVNDWCDFGHNAQPATKEQRDLLFKKMKEVGYEWDAENKELIKDM